MTGASGGPATRSAQIAGQLRDDILRGAYQPGERLPAERQIAARLGVNRSSVREALKRLEQLGLVTIRRGGGATVRRLQDSSLEVVRHLFLVKGRLNPAIAAQVFDVQEMLVAGAARIAVERASEEELRRARELVDRLGGPDQGDAAYLEVTEELMALVTEASGNLVLQLMRRALQPLFLEQFAGLGVRLRPASGTLASLLEALDRALATRDATGAEEAVRALLRDGRRRLQHALGEGRVRAAARTAAATADGGREPRTTRRREADGS